MISTSNDIKYAITEPLKNCIWCQWPTNDIVTPGPLRNVSLQVALSKYYAGAKGSMKMADLQKKVFSVSPHTVMRP